MARTRDFADVIRAKMAADPDLAEAVESASFSADVARKVYEARKSAGLSQKKLAELSGTHQSVISRIEDADYDGHSLKLLQRIAAALDRKLHIEFSACPSASDEKVEGKANRRGRRRAPSGQTLSASASRSHRRARHRR